MTVGLLSSQQESFDQHEELSKLLHETDVFYVPLRNDFNQQQDLSDLTKRFDEDILNKHLVVVSDADSDNCARTNRIHLHFA